MNVSRRSFISAACGLILATGMVVILVLITASLLPLPIQQSITSFIFIFSLLVTAALVSRRLSRLVNINKILGWTFIGVGMEFIAFPFSLLSIIKSASSAGVIMVAMTVFVYSLILGLSAGLISIIIGIFLIKSRQISMKRTSYSDDTG